MESPKPPKKKLDLNRREMPKQPHDVRSHNFDEVALGYSAETAIEEAVALPAMSKRQLRQDLPG